MTDALSEFQAKFRVDDLQVLRTESWTWSVRPVQATLGAGVLSLNRQAESFGELSHQEGADLVSIVADVERALGAYTAPDRMNYLMLMMIDAHVHFHVLPRYSAPRTAAGHEWIDAGWPAQPGLGDNADLSTPEVLTEIRDALRSAVQKG
jgi:diadenosine tetraphosphate (Ap4A) HIT family hydrolase